MLNFNFQIKGDRAKWVALYEKLAELKPQETITYAELTAVAGFDVLADRSPLYSAFRQLSDKDKRSVINIPGVGYRIATAEEHMARSKHHQLKGKRQTRKAKRHVTNVHQEELTPQQRVSFEGQASRMAKMESALVNHGERIKSLEKAQTKTGMQVDQHSRELSQIQARLKSLGYTATKS
jgi:hypothetical protein